MSKWQRRRRRLLRSALGLAGLLLAAYLVLLGLMWHWVAKPPVLTEEPAITRLTNEVRGGRAWLGRNWLERREGLPVLYLRGTPFEIGYANAALTAPMIRRQEDAVLELMHRVAPYRWTQFLLKFLVTYKNRHLQENIPAAYQMEILGMTRGCPDPHPEVGPAFHRVLNYHAAQDISYMLMNSPLPDPRSTTLVSPATICTPASRAAVATDCMMASRSLTRSPSSRIKPSVRYSGVAPCMARSLTVPQTARRPMSPPGKNSGRTT